MPDLHARLPRNRFLALPDHGRAASAARRVGVEIEFAGLSVHETAVLIAGHWGGELAEQNPREVHVTGGRLGKVRVELDIALKAQWAEDLAAQVLRDLVPVEVITDPLSQADLPQVERMAQVLHAAGAMGTRAKLAYGFGVHFNPELPDDDGAALVATARAYALCEDWLRGAEPLDPARRVLPFVDPWPRALVAALAGAEGWGVRDLARACVAHAPSRHHGLDLLPALQHLCPAELSQVPESHLKGGRPTFHYRLPETRLDEPGWSIAYEWNRWCLIEHIAADPDLLRALANGWTDHESPLSRLRGNWAAAVEEMLATSALPARLGL